MKIFTYIAIFISFLWVFYWVHNANNPVIKTVDITIKNLPELWKTKKIVFISDMHLWAIVREQCFEKVISKINSLNPDLVFITWDLFDWTDWDLEHMTSYINSIESKEGIYFVTWNHETYLWNDITNELLAKTKVNILNDEIKIIDWVQIVWISYLDNRTQQVDINEKLNSLVMFDKNIPSILLYHSPVFINDFINFWINLQLSWHTHKWQIWPFWYITSLIYNWKDYWLYTSWDYNLYTTNWIGVWWPPIRTWNTPEIVVLNLK